MIRRSEPEVVVLTLDGRPLVIAGRYRLRLLKVHKGKALIDVADLQEKPPLVSDVDEGRREDVE